MLLPLSFSIKKLQCQKPILEYLDCSFAFESVSDFLGTVGLWESKTRVRSSNTRVTSSNPGVESSNLRVTTSNLRVTSSNLRVTSYNQ